MHHKCILAFLYDYFNLENLKDVLKCPCNYICKSTLLNHKLKLMENIWIYQEHVTCIGDGTNVYKILVRKLERKRPSEGLGYIGRIILKCMFKEEDVSECVCVFDSNPSG
jgi:hypothetical protein